MFTITHNASIYSGCNGVENKPDIFHMQTKTQTLFLWPKTRFSGRRGEPWLTELEAVGSAPEHVTLMSES